MPLVLCETIAPACWLAIWQIAESQAFFLERLPLDEYTSEELEGISHPQKQLEWLASRYCLEHLAQHVGLVHSGLSKDEFGKPFLSNCTAEMSLTHTTEYVAVAIHLSQAIGIDMERPSEKLRKIANKYLADDEQTASKLDLRQLCIYWSAKEALYKLYGRKKLHFKENIRVDPFATEAERLVGSIVLPEGTQHYHIYTRWLGEYVLVLAF